MTRARLYVLRRKNASRAGIDCLQGGDGVKKRWIVWGILGLLACCGGRGEPVVRVDLYEGRLCVYEGTRLVHEQTLECACAAPPVGSWTLVSEGEDGYRLACPWGEYRLETDARLPAQCRVEVTGPVEDCLSLRPGMRGAGVFRMQQGLCALGYLDEAPTGVYDERTRAAVYACFGAPGALSRPSQMPTPTHANATR